jgi:RecJ-like exonuclease
MKNFIQLNKNDVRKRFNFLCKIEEIKQTSGPTIFTINDGSRSIKSVAFSNKPGTRAYPELNSEDIIEISAMVSERDGIIELELKDVKLVTDDFKKKLFIGQLNAILDKESTADDVEFIVESEPIKKLLPHIKKVASEIKKAILTNRPIILRHHADCDGYCAGIALERAILPLIKKRHETDSAEWFYYKRAPSKAPFYEYTDVVKDLSFTIDDMNKFGQKAPLIILADNGSTHEDLLAIKKIKIYGAKVVVIDHHFPGKVENGKVEVDKYVDAHVNPYLIGFDSTLTAGVLGTEIARFINKDVDGIKHLAALAAVGDRAKGPIIEKYLDIAHKIGLDDKYLAELAECIDFESYYIRFMESRGLVNDLLGSDVEKQRQMVKLMIEDINQRKETVLKATSHYMKRDDSGKYTIITLQADGVTSRGEYPAIGKTVGMTHDYVISKNNGKGVISIGIGPDFMTLRMSDEVDFNINTIIEELKEKMPYTAVDGGGHEHAGSIKFLEAGSQEIKEFVMNRLKNL